MIEHFGISTEHRIELYKYIVARSDITSALYTTRLFIKTVKDIKDEGFRPLQESLIVAYARPFRRSKPYGKLDKRWSDFDDEELQSLHKLILEHRDSLVAHSDLKYRNVQIVPPGTSNITSNKKNSGVAVQLSSLYLEMSIFPTIERLCLDIGRRLNTEIDLLMARTYETINLPSKPFDLL